jgi:hypothetical protein
MRELKSDSDGGGVIVKFETPNQRDARLDDEYRAAVQEEAIEMLERAIVLAKERGVAGIAISVCFTDGTYGRLIPNFTTNTSGLIGAVATTQHDLCLRTLTEDL